MKKKETKNINDSDFKNSLKMSLLTLMKLE